LSKQEISNLLEELARELADIREGEKSGVLLYAEAGPGWAGLSIYTSSDNSIVWHSPPNEVSDLIMMLWNVMQSHEKWRGMTMFVAHNRFRTEFDYGEGWNEEEDEGDRREPIVREFFGNKPIYYPPLEGAEPWPQD